MKRLVLIGGGEWQKDDGVDRYLADIAKNEIGLIAFGADKPEAVQNQMQQVYSRFHCDVKMVESTPDLIGQRVVYLADGDSERLIKELRRRGMAKPLREDWAAGGVLVAGAAAGAIAVFEKVLAIVSKKAGHVGVVDGLGLVKGNRLFVPYWNRTEPAWRLSLLNAYAGYQIIAADERTALVVNEDKAEVMGSGSIHIFQEPEQYRTGEWVDFKLD